MKIRWKATELRFRITPTELARILAGESVTEVFAFPNGWRATISSATETDLRFSDSGVVTVTLSESDREQLGKDDSEGVYFQRDADGPVIRYYVEKDFPCLHPRASEVLSEEGETFAPTESFLARAEQQ